MSGPTVSQTRSSISIIWVACQSVPEGLRKLADEIEQRGHVEQVINVGLTYTGLDDEFQYQLDAYIEDVH